VFNLTFQGQFVVTLPVLILMVVLLINYRNITKSKKNILNFMAWILRFGVILITLFLLADPYLHFTRTREALPDISVFIDSSSSMKYNTGDLTHSLDQTLKTMLDWFRDRSDKLSVFEFNSAIYPADDVNEIEYTHPLTDFSTIPAVINTTGSKINFIITDGIATSGPDPSTLKLRPNQTLHVIAAENTTPWKDISIEKIDYPATVIQGDTVVVTSVIRAKSTEEIRTELRIQDKEGEIMAHQMVVVEAGDGMTEISVPVVVRQGQVPDLVTVIPVNGEQDILNNNFSLQLNVLSDNEHILLVTGALSPNTTLIKEILTSLPRSEIDHYFRLGGSIWNKPTTGALSYSPKLIILDNFPVLNDDRSIFNDLMKNAKAQGTPVVFLEGANSGLQTTSLIGQLAKLRAEKARIKTLLAISTTRAGGQYFRMQSGENFPPASIIHQWQSDQNHTNLLTYSDGSPAMMKIEMPFPFYGVLIPELSKLNFKLTRTSSPDLLKKGLKNIFQSSMYSEDDLVFGRLEKRSYNLGEIVNVKGEYHDEYLEKPDRMTFLVMTESGELVQEIPAVFDVDSKVFKGSFLADKSGSLQVVTHSVWNNGNEVTSSPQYFVVQDVVVEDRNLQANRKALLMLSSKNDGEFYSLNDIDKMVQSLIIVPEKKTESYRLSTVSTHRWWWTIIILLSVEWFIRKRIGLL